MGTIYESILNEYADSIDITERLKSQISDELTTEEKFSLLLEIQILNFYFKEGDLCQDYISDFSPEEWKYISFRSNQNVTPFLKARYSHLLYKHTKHTTQGSLTRELYGELCESYLINQPDDNSFAIFCQCLECYLVISIKTNIKIAEAKTQVIKYIYDGRIPFSWKDHLIELLLRNPKFKKTDILGLTAFMLSFHPEDIGSISITERYLENCLKLGQREGVDINRIYVLLAENSVKHAEARASDKTGIIRVHALSQALNYFRLAKEKIKENEVSLKLVEQKKKIGLPIISVESTAEEAQTMINEMDSLISFLFSQDRITVLNYLVENKNLFKSERDLEKDAKKAMLGSFYGFINVQVYDINNNAKTLTTEDEKIAHLKNQNYSIQLQTVQYFLDRLFYTGFHTGKLMAADIIQFLNQNWFIVKLSDLKDKQSDKTFSWIELIGPGIIHLLTQLEQSFLDKLFKPDFVLSIDSLSLKIEGIVRDLARLSGLAVTKMGKHGAEEMNLDDLLRDEAIVKLFYPEDIYLWKFLLTPTGWNLRNNAAHSFLRPKHYSKSKAILILLAIFRLCKYGYIVT